MHCGSQIRPEVEIETRTWIFQGQERPGEMPELVNSSAGEIHRSLRCRGRTYDVLYKNGVRFSLQNGRWVESEISMKIQGQHTSALQQYLGIRRANH